jgi:hypothetical protein
MKITTVPGGGGAALPAGFIVHNRGDAPLTVYAPDGAVLGVAPPGSTFPPPPGIYWKRTGGKTWRVEIIREVLTAAEA